VQFKDVIGQKELKQHFVLELANNKVGHAQLLLGKPGYGTLPIALAFAQYLFCENRTEDESCGECPACKKVSTGQHPDLHFSFPTVGSISKTTASLLSLWRERISEDPYFDLNDWIRKMDPGKERRPIISTEEGDEIIKRLSLKSFEGGRKLIIIWMPEQMNNHCANKLLKIIEEPPGDTIFLLVSEDQEKLLQTIVSRTQLIKVPRLSMDETSKHLLTKSDIHQDTAESIASRVDGDLVSARRILESHEDEDENRRMFVQLMRVCYKKNVLDMMDWSAEIAGLSRARQKVFLEYALHMFRQSMLRNYTDDQLTRTSAEETTFLENFSRFISGNNVFDFMQTFNDAHYHIDRNANGKILFTNLCFQVMRYIHVA